MAYPYYPPNKTNGRSSMPIARTVTYVLTYACLRAVVIFNTGHSWALFHDYVGRAGIGSTRCHYVRRTGSRRASTNRARSAPASTESTVAELTRIGESELGVDARNCRRWNSLRELSYRVALPGDTGPRNGNINSRSSRRAKSWFEAEIGLRVVLHLAPMTGFRREMPPARDRTRRA